jgi:hypothetical protein
VTAPAWTITVTEGPYEGRSWSGDRLADCPVTILVSEGIVSARTQEEAQRLREALSRSLPRPGRTTIGAASWAIEAERSY